MTYHDILNILIFNRKQILTVTIISSIIFGLLHFIVSPVSYSAEVTVLPPSDEEPASLSNLLAGGGDISSFLSLGGSRANSLLNAEILKSRSVAEAVIDTFKLLDYFDTDDIHVAASKLQKIISVEVTKEGILKFSIEMETPYFGRFTKSNDLIKKNVALIANKFVEILDKVNNEKVNIKAKSSRIFVEKQVAEIKTKLDSSEQKLKEFQQQYKTVSLNDQLSAAIENAAKLKSEIVTTEIQISSLKFSLSDESQTIQNLNKKLGILKQQYQKFDSGEKGETDYLPAFSEVPDIIKTYAELTRDVKIFNEVYLFLQKQYFKETIQENKTVSTVQVLDPAVVPFKSSGPKLVLDTIVFAIIMFLLTILINIYKEKNRAKMKKTVVITGGAGFLGSHLCDKMIAEGYRVICVDNLLTGNVRNIEHLFGNEDFTFIKHDITNFIHVPGEVHYILHFASPASPIDYLKLPIQTLKVGSLGTHKVLGLAKEKKARILLASTSEVYGDPVVHPQREDYWGNVNPIGPRGVYDEAKRFAEAMTMAYNRYHHVETRIVRIFNTYGPRMRLNDGRALPAFVSQALNGEDITVFGDGSQTRSFCYVSDLVDGIYKLLLSDTSDPINIGNPAEITIKQFAEEVIKITNANSKIIYHPLPEDDPKVRQPDITKAKAILGWEPKVDRAEGLRITIDYFKSIVK